MDKTRVAIRLPILIISISIVLSSIGSPAETDEIKDILPSKLPNQGVTEAGRRDFARMKAKHHPDDWVHHFDFSQGLSQNAPPLLLGNRLYIMGGASNNYAPSNASAEVIVGTIVK